MRAEWEICSRSFDHFADNLMARNDTRMEWPEIALDDVEIGAADAAGNDFEEELMGRELRARQVFDGKPCAGSGGGSGVEDGCAHGERIAE